MSIEHTPGIIFGSIISDLAATMADLGPSAPDEPNLTVQPEVKIIGRLGDFHIVDVRHGGMGEVYLCFRDGDEQRVAVALKSLKPDLQFNPATRRAFQRECALWAFASIAPDIFPLYGMTYIDGRPFITMPGVLPGPQGEINLSDLLRAGPLSINEAVFFASAMAKWLSLAAHVVPGLVHGDLTPANVLIRGGVPWISDFGLARITGQSLGGDTLIGTRAYCSPLARDPKASLTVVDDVYSFGVILEEMVTGVILGRRKPGRRERTSTSDATARVRHGLLALAQRCQARDPALRPGDFKVISGELEHLAPEEQWPKPDSAWLMPSPTPTPVRLDMVAETLVGLEEYNLTLQFIATMTNKRTRSWTIWKYQGFALSQTGHQRKALRCYRKALARWNGKPETEKHDTDILLLLGSEAHMRLGRHRYPVWILRRIIDKSSQQEAAHAAAVHSLASLYTEMRCYRQAEWLLRERQTDTDDALHWNNLGVIYLRLRDSTHAADAYRRAVKLAPWNAEYHSGLGQALINIPGHVPDALAAFNRAIGCGSLKQEIFTYAIACAVLLGDFDEIFRLHRLIRRSCEWMMTSKIETAAFRLAHDIASGTVPSFRQARNDKRWEKRNQRRVDAVK